MSENILPFRRPINWAKLRSDEAEAIIRHRASPDTTGNVVFTNHTWQRVSEREIPTDAVYKILRTGWVSEGPFQNENGEWQVTVAKPLKGNRNAGVVTVIVDDDKTLVVLTVEWMDL